MFRICHFNIILYIWLTEIKKTRHAKGLQQDEWEDGKIGERRSGYKLRTQEDAV